MRILLVNAYARSGGASVAARRLTEALDREGAEVRLLVQNQEGEMGERFISTPDPWAARRPLLDALPVLPLRNRRSPHWSNAWLSNGPVRRALREAAPDLVHLHWVNHGMLSIRDVARIDVPVVWTLHDAWAFTGGCHSPQECRAYEARCGRCPELRSSREHDLSRWVWRRKQKTWRNASFTCIAPSHWLAERAGQSSLLRERRIDVIPNALDTELFRPRDREAARRTLGLPLHAPLFLFAAHGAFSDWNKGGDLWRAALPFVRAHSAEAIALVAGVPAGTLGSMCLPVHELGLLQGADMAAALAAADVTVVPSRMENLPNIVAESLACGTPVAAFAVGGIPEMIQPGVTGFLAPAFDVEALAGGICALFASGTAARSACAAFAEATYAPRSVAQRHLALYKELLSLQ